MMIKDPGEISSVLNFLSKKLGKQNKDDYQKKKEILGIERTEGKDKMMFYNVKCQELDNKSLLQFINLENVRLITQREELIDLSVKIASLNNISKTSEEAVAVVNTKKAMEEVINHYKSGLPSGVGLRDMITLIKERFPWSSSKRGLKIFLSLLTCLLGIGLFVLDVYTDVRFSVGMFNINKTLVNDDESFNASISRVLSKNGLKFASIKAHSQALECLKDLEINDRRTNFSTDRQKARSESGSWFCDYFDCDYFDDIRLTGMIAIWHCIQPFFITTIVFISMKCCKRGKCLTPFQLANLKDPLWWGFNTITCCIPNLAFIGSMLPIPGFTHLFRFYLDVKCHYARSKPDFRTKIVKYEQKIGKHEAIGKL